MFLWLTSKSLCKEAKGGSGENLTMVPLVACSVTQGKLFYLFQLLLVSSVRRGHEHLPSVLIELCDEKVGSSI